jgi:hypothetical protein
MVEDFSASVAASRRMFVAVYGQSQSYITTDRREVTGFYSAVTVSRIVLGFT